MKHKRPIRIEGNVAYVPLTRGYEAIIDAADVGLVQGHNWAAHLKRRKDGSLWGVYAVRNEFRDGKFVNIAMHRVIAGTPPGMVTDHKDGNGLNNRRANLRSASHSQNSQNCATPINNKSGFKGVYWSRIANKWAARIAVNKKIINLGHYDDKLAAARIYAEAAVKLHGDFARPTPSAKDTTHD